MDPGKSVLTLHLVHIAEMFLKNEYTYLLPGVGYHGFEDEWKQGMVCAES